MGVDEPYGIVDGQELEQGDFIAEEVEATKTPRELKRENKTVTVITGVPARMKWRRWHNN